MNTETTGEPTTANRTTSDHQTTPTAPIPNEDSVDASIAARRVQLLTAIVMERLNDTDRHTDDPETLMKGAVEHLYQVHPHIRLDDALELVNIVKVPPRDVSTRQAIECVVNEACTHLAAWGRFTSPKTATPVSRERTRVGS
ncbi:hypothetical protein EFA46_015775 (plasmid) [Halarchaeum sp. CBA1220]|uniref:hypothetical protein n=1 Tax=Halarchaeum sp. CBA1220 TaxID=1853682 RepID=UPI000F3A93B9|nr:hypothetical protein [Halarchaeum sp. CBA1220]QLC35712.1 hypothetical protein EFA46_015775 [Halarchaeum sp. CBA1220]